MTKPILHFIDPLFPVDPPPVTPTVPTPQLTPRESAKFQIYRKAKLHFESGKTCLNGKPCVFPAELRAKCNDLSKKEFDDALADLIRERTIDEHRLGDYHYYTVPYMDFNDAITIP